MKPAFLALALAATPSVARAQCPDGTPPPCRSAVRAPTTAANSVAVLYFDNLSHDTADTYLADGFTEEVMSRLAQVERLQVKSRTAVQRLRGRTMDEPAAVGRSLGVAHLVSGSVLRSGGRVRVTVELTRVASGNSVWGKSFDRAAADLIGTEAEIAESVAVNVGARLAPAERRRIEARATQSAEAYDHMLRGRFEGARRTPAALQRAVHEYEEAVRADPNFVQGWVGLAQVNSGLGSLYYRADFGIPRDTFIQRSRAAAERALALDSTSADAWIVRATGGDPSRAAAAYARAVQLDPRNPESHHQLALSLRILGHDSEAIREFRQALALDPDRTITLINLGQTYYMLRNYREARRWTDSVVAMRPDAPFIYLDHGMVALMLGDTAETRRAAALVAAHGSADGEQELLAMLEARSGDTASARRRALHVDSAAGGRDCWISHECLEVAMALAAAGLPDRAMDMLERVTPHDNWLAFWMNGPEFDALRSEPRYRRLLAASRAAPGAVSR